MTDLTSTGTCGSMNKLARHNIFIMTVEAEITALVHKLVLVSRAVRTVAGSTLSSFNGTMYKRPVVKTVMTGIT
jgi:hypothetical protein